MNFTSKSIQPEKSQYLFVAAVPKKKHTHAPIWNLDWSPVHWFFWSNFKIGLDRSLKKGEMKSIILGGTKSKPATSGFQIFSECQTSPRWKAKNTTKTATQPLNSPKKNRVPSHATVPYPIPSQALLSR